MKLFPWRAWWTSLSAVALPRTYCSLAWWLLHCFHTKKAAPRTITTIVAQRRIEPVVMRMLPPDLRPVGHPFHCGNCSSRLVYTTLNWGAANSERLPLARELGAVRAWRAEAAPAGSRAESGESSPQAWLFCQCLGQVGTG